MQAPRFWAEPSFISTLLAPVAGIYGLARKQRQASGKPVKVDVPVICVGNLVAGGAGKTPVALAVAHSLAAQGKRVHLLSRGYGSKAKGVIKVDPSQHHVIDVGDEALLLGAYYPCWVSRDRVAAAKEAVKDGAQVIVMDDGFQNPSLSKDLSLLVIDGHYGLGNLKLFPAGPLRETVEDGAKRADAIVIIHPPEGGAPWMEKLPKDKTILTARMVPSQSSVKLKGKRVMAFAGIGRPEKFYLTLQELGCELAGMVSYADHHHFSDTELSDLRKRAQEADAMLVTTAKDAVRLPEDFRKGVSVVTVDLVFDSPAEIHHLLKPYAV